jgi:acetyltransferase-like isoleucine patch superfamily enzyme
MSALNARNLFGLGRWLFLKARAKSRLTGLFFLDRRSDILIEGDGHLIVGQGTIVMQDLVARIEAPVMLGERVFFNRGCHIVVKAGLEVGDDTLFGEYASIHDETHVIKDGQVEDRNTFTARPVRIGTKVWIGTKATILPGVTIGDRSIIGAGAVVTKDIPEGSVAVGIPARVIKSVADLEH